MDAHRSHGNWLVTQQDSPGARSPCVRRHGCTRTPSRNLRGRGSWTGSAAGAPAAGPASHTAHPASAEQVHAQVSGACRIAQRVRVSQTLPVYTSGEACTVGHQAAVLRDGDKRCQMAGSPPSGANLPRGCRRRGAGPAALPRRRRAVLGSSAVCPRCGCPPPPQSRQAASC